MVTQREKEQEHQTLSKRPGLSTAFDPCCVSQPCSAQAAVGASHLSPFMSEEGESGAEVPEEEEGQTGQDSVALPGPAHSSVSTVSSLTD
ncbi:ATP-dependent RNA helicase DRS1 [Dissostichus eleginoides]|uniref:ATP-dependent RNA helicase DRS1 n=1 Tax=Dissostichus eleginoides TaxID=100907 RepID=A0AAD9CBU7_DISEL|nr:ATP-dependent RNA helicase DRS1 [Dissostichus eleginoides]